MSNSGGENLKIAVEKPFLSRPAIHTILHSPDYLMGLDDKDVAVVRETARKTLRPDLHRALEIGQVAERMMEQAKKGLMKKEVVASYRLAEQKAASDTL